MTEPAARPRARRCLHPKHGEERLKLGASGLQATALTLIAGVVLAPALNGSLVAPVWARVATFIGASVAEMAAFRLLAYIPVSKELWPWWVWSRIWRSRSRRSLWECSSRT